MISPTDMVMSNHRRCGTVEASTVRGFGDFTWLKDGESVSLEFDLPGFTTKKKHVRYLGEVMLRKPIWNQFAVQPCGEQTL